MRYTISASVCVLMLGAASATLRAEEDTGVDLQAALQKTVLLVPATVFLSEAPALQQSGAAPGMGEHKLGVGVRTGGFGFGIGALAAVVVPAGLGFSGRRVSLRLRRFFQRELLLDPVHAGRSLRIPGN
jgi:hypothetical protein